MTSRDSRRCCEAVRSAILATAWLLVAMSPFAAAGNDALAISQKYTHVEVSKLFERSMGSRRQSQETGTTNPFDAHCCHMGTAIKHPVPDRVKQKQSFVSFDIRAL